MDDQAKRALFEVGTRIGEAMEDATPIALTLARCSDEELVAAVQSLVDAIEEIAALASSLDLTAN